MQRFSLSNLVMPIGFAQFVRMAGHFIDVCGEAFGSGCDVMARVHSRDHVYTTFLDPAIEEAVEKANRERLLRSGPGLPNEDEWTAARHVEMFVRPSNLAASMPHAFAHAEFKGVRPRQATFYVQCADFDVASAMAEAWPRMRRGNGFKGNGVNAGLVPAATAAAAGFVPRGFRTA